MTQIAPRMRYAPASEQEVIVLFALLLPDLPFRLELDEVHTAFPDCLAWRVNEDGRETAVRIEFELCASHFYAHGHPCDSCDYIVCWEDDMPEDRKLPRRLPLRPLAEKASPPVIKLPLARLSYFDCQNRRQAAKNQDVAGFMVVYTKPWFLAR